MPLPACRLRSEFTVKDGLRRSSSERTLCRRRATGWVRLRAVAVWQCHLSRRPNPCNRSGLWHATQTATHPQKVAVWQSAPRHGPRPPARVQGHCRRSIKGSTAGNRGTSKTGGVGLTVPSVGKHSDPQTLPLELVRDPARWGARGRSPAVAPWAARAPAP
jgi:hypothetical protein